MSIWPRPESLLPPRLVAGLEAALNGDTTRAVELCAGADGRDPLAGDLVRLVGALAARERGETSRTRRDLRTLVSSADPALALVAATTLVDDWVAQRRYAVAQSLLRRLRPRQRDAAGRTWTEALQLGVELQRRGSVAAARVGALEQRLDRRQPAAVHAAVHLLRAERALLAGELPDAVGAQREARPYVRSSGLAILRRKLDVLSQSLRAPFADVEDWEEPLRTVSREELADLESRPWRLWVDVLHRRVRSQPRRNSAALTFELGATPLAWETLELLARAPQRRLTWSQAATALAAPDAAAARARVERLASELGTAASAITTSTAGVALSEARFVVVLPPATLPQPALRLLGELAAKPGAAAAALVERGAARRTVVQHLARLRRAGYVRLVGGGNEQRYRLV